MLDWEFAHLSDPIEDLAWPLVRAWRFGADDKHLGGIGEPRALPRALRRADRPRGDARGAARLGGLRQRQVGDRLPDPVAPPPERPGALGRARRARAARRRDGVRAAGPDRPCRMTARRPQELAEAVREFLQDEILPILDDHRLKFRTIVAINGLGIAERELWATTPPREEDWELARRIRAGDVPENVVALLKEQVAEKLRVSNPAPPGEVRRVRRRLYLMRHADVSYVDDAGQPVQPRRSAADAARARAGGGRARARSRASSSTSSSRATCRAPLRPLRSSRRVTRPSAGRTSPSGAAAGSTRSRRTSSSTSSSAPSGSRRGRALPRRRVARRSSRPRPPRARPARRARVGHGARSPPRRRQPDRHLLRALRRPDLLRHVRAGARVHQRARSRRRRLDRAHGQLRPVRPAPPRARARRWSTSGRS